MANISCPTCISSLHVPMWCSGCGRKLTVAPLSYFLTSDVCVDELPREISQLMTNTYAQVKAPHSATAIPGTTTTTYGFVSVAQEVEYLVTSHGAFGPFQHVCRADGLVTGSPYSALWLQAHCWRISPHPA